MKLTRVTITGADESVLVSDLFALRNDFPFVEFGILASVTREGKEPRYPGLDWLNRACTGSLPISAHLCGQFSRDAIDGPFLWAIERYGMFRNVNRIQFNGANPDYAPTRERVDRYALHFPDKEFILQTKSFSPVGFIQNRKFAWLLDNSGGRGIELETLPDPIIGSHCGYSGGIGPENIDRICQTLTSNPNESSVWIDMESNIRSEVNGKSVFDLVKVRMCLEIASKYVAATT